jgi:ABC-type nickel/cobalt efflux system permease component RcnA
MAAMADMSRRCCIGFIVVMGLAPCCARIIALLL